MSSYELAKILIDRIPESKILYVLSYLQGVVVPDDIVADVKAAPDSSSRPYSSVAP